MSGVRWEILAWVGLFGESWIQNEGNPHVLKRGMAQTELAGQGSFPPRGECSFKHCPNFVSVQGVGMLGMA